MARSWFKAILWTVGGLLGLAGLAAYFVQEKGLVQRVYLYQDGRSSLRLSGSSTLREVSWSAPREVPEGNAAPNPPPESPHWSSPAILLNAVRGPNGDFDLHVREMASTGWSASRPIPGAVNSPGDEISPTLSPDGSILFFASNRPGGLGGFDLYLSRRTRDGWGKPRNLGSRINSPYDEKGPALHPSSSVLVFATNRPRSFILTPPSEWTDVPLGSWKAGNDLLARVERSISPDGVGEWSEVLPLEALSSPASSREPCFSPSGDFLYFASDRKGGAGGLDIYRAQVQFAGDQAPNISQLRVEPPESCGAPLNSRYDEHDPRILLDGHALVFRVAETQGGTESLFESRTREVSSELEFATVPLRALGARALRLTALVLGGISLLLATIVLLRHRERWSTSLVLRSSVLAILAHAAMLYGFYFWVVSEDIIALAEKKTSMEEVTVERTLQAKLLEETMRMDVAALAREAPVQPTIRASGRVVEISSIDVTAPEAVDAPITPARPVPVESAAESPEERAVKETALELEVSRAIPEAVPVTESLPPPAPSEPERDTTDLTARGTQSLKAELETPRPGPLLRVQTAAPTLEHLGEIDLVAATTQLQAPVETLSSLPPLARHTPETPAVVTALSVPAQSQEVTPERRLAAPEVSPRMTIGKASHAVNAPGLPEVRATEVHTAESLWRAQISGILPAPSHHAEARELPENSLALAPITPIPQTPGATVKLEETVALAEVRSSSREDASDPRPRGSDHFARPSAPARGTLSAELASVVSRPESRPLSVESSAVAAPALASSAQMDAVPSPGVLEKSQLPGIERSSLRSPLATLSEGEGGAKPARGAPVVTDILFAGRAAQREWRPAFPSTPGSSLELLEVQPGPSASLSPLGTVVGRPKLSGSTKTAGSTPAQASLPAEATAKASAVTLKLPEAPPDLRREKDLAKVRSPEAREVLVSQMGGTQASEDAVRMALEWLARHQSRDGRWDVDGFDADCRSCQSPGVQTDCDAAVTALALLCFLGQNHTPQNPLSPFKKHTQAAISWLLQIQGLNGSLAGADERYTMYTHGIATLALSEALILTKDPRLEEPVRLAVRLIITTQNRTTGGWRYKPQPPLRGDTSITGWQVLALVSARGAGVQVPEVVLDRARHWIDHEVAGGQHGGIFGYTRPEKPRVAMTAEGMFARLLLGGKRTDRNIEEAARYIHTETRDGGYLDNLYLLYYGNLALYHYQGWIWERWNNEVREFLVRSQQRTGTRAGSWDPSGQYTKTGGRVLSTCFAALTLEVYYRYLPLYWTLDKSAK